VLGGSMNDPQCLELMRCGGGAHSAGSFALRCTTRLPTARSPMLLQGRFSQPRIQPGGALQPARCGPLLRQVRGVSAAAPASSAVCCLWCTCRLHVGTVTLAPCLNAPHVTCSVNVRGKEDMADVLDVVEWAAEQLPGSDKQVAVIGYVPGRRHAAPRGPVRVDALSWYWGFGQAVAAASILLFVLAASVSAQKLAMQHNLPFPTLGPADTPGEAAWPPMPCPTRQWWPMLASASHWGA
jgi:hypothetical protein